jgi:hypothetical protein
VRLISLGDANQKRHRTYSKPILETAEEEGMTTAFAIFSREERKRVARFCKDFAREGDTHILSRDLYFSATEEEKT